MASMGNAGTGSVTVQRPLDAGWRTTSIGHDDGRMRHNTLVRYYGRVGRGDVRRRGTKTAAAYCTIWALVAMLVSFRALMALTILFLLLLVEGWGQSAQTDTHTHTDALELHAFRGTGANGGQGIQAVERQQGK